MTYPKFLPVAAFALALGVAQPALAAGAFTCPTAPIEAAQAAKVAAALPTGDAFDRVEALNAAITSLKSQGVGPVLLIDSLISAYCPIVAAQPGLSDAQKTLRMGRFAARVTRAVYGYESADAIFLDVSFPPQIVSAIEAKAKAAGVPAEDWIRGVVDAALK